MRRICSFTWHFTTSSFKYTLTRYQMHILQEVQLEYLCDWLQGEWAEGMKAVEDAMWVTPRSIHQ